MGGLQEFMVIPDNLDDILNRLESARQRIYE
jgi:multiple sugar transport system substrate-binding protein